MVERGRGNQCNNIQESDRRESSGREHHSRGDNDNKENQEQKERMVTHEQDGEVSIACRARPGTQSDGREREIAVWPSTVHRISGLGQLVLQGDKRQVQGSNWLNPAQPRRPWGSTQTLLSRHNRVKHPCRDSHAVIHAWGIARIPRVVSREDRIQLPSEKDQNYRRLMNVNHAKPIVQPQLLQGWDQQHDNNNNTTTTSPLRGVSQESSITIMITKTLKLGELNIDVGPMEKMDWSKSQHNSWLGPPLGHGAIWCRSDQD